MIKRNLILLIVSIVYVGLFNFVPLSLANGLHSDDELHEPEPAQLEQELNDLSRVREEFISLKKAGKIHSIKPDETGWSGDVAKVTRRYIKLSPDFNNEQFKQELSVCNDLFRAELTHADSKRKIIGFFV